MAPVFVHYTFRPWVPRDDAADEAFDFLAGIRQGRRVTRADVESARAILAAVGRPVYVARQDLTQALMWLDLMSQVDVNGLEIKNYVGNLEREVVDMEAEIADLTADLERSRRGP